MVEIEPLQHLVNDRVLALAQHALDAGMKCRNAGSPQIPTIGLGGNAD